MGIHLFLIEKYSNIFYLNIVNMDLKKNIWNKFSYLKIVFHYSYKWLFVVVI